MDNEIEIKLEEELEEQEINLEEELEEQEIKLEEELEEQEINLEDETKVYNLDYNLLKNKPKINSIELKNDKSFTDLGLSDMTNFEIENLLT